MRPAVLVPLLLFAAAAAPLAAQRFVFGLAGVGGDYREATNDLRYDVSGLAGTDLAYASSAINFVRQLGGAIGINLLAVMLEWRLSVYANDPARAFHQCFAVVTLAFALAIVPAFAIRPSPR